MGTFFSDISIQPLSQINKKNPIFFHDNRLFFGATIQISSQGLYSLAGFIKIIKKYVASLFFKITGSEYALFPYQSHIFPLLHYYNVIFSKKIVCNQFHVLNNGPIINVPQSQIFTLFHE